ncbi:ATP/GTP-binding protein [Streptomyces sp. NPDC051907]|uniref:GTP-binding protein n=1 Tax=Streptomyces sp. NPDC051907 TaxID=3155284 RepID=UPI00342995F5
MTTRLTRAAAPAQTHPALAGSTVNALKIVVVGGFGVGKTTMIRSVSEIRPLHTEEVISRAGRDLDAASAVQDKAVQDKNATTVAFDFGRITLDERSVLYLFGAPGQGRFWFLWERLLSGTLGAVVLVDTRSLDASWYAIDRLERQGTPFIVAVNDFGGPLHSEDRIREALALGPDVPLVEFDARDHSSSKFVLIALIEHLHTLSLREEGAAEADRDRAPDQAPDQATDRAPDQATDRAAEG